MPIRSQFKNQCSACGGPIQAKVSREVSRSRQNTLCKRCFSATGTCVCGCGRSFLLYNGVGHKREYFDGSCYYNVPAKRQIAVAKQSKAKKSDWKRRSYREARSGENHHAWQGGVWPYPSEFNKELKEAIKKRDGYKCRNPQCPNKGKIRLLHVHHRDDNKQHNDPENLITLCDTCHHAAHPHKGQPPLVLNY